MWRAAGGAGVGSPRSVGITCFACVSRTTFLLDLCWCGQTHLRLVLLPCSVLLQLSQTGRSILLLSKPYLLLHIASREVTIWDVSHRILFPHKFVWNLHLFALWKSLLLNASLSFWGTWEMDMMLSNLQGSFGGIKSSFMWIVCPSWLLLALLCVLWPIAVRPMLSVLKKACLLLVNYYYWIIFLSDTAAKMIFRCLSCHNFLYYTSCCVCHVNVLICMEKK